MIFSNLILQMNRLLFRLFIVSGMIFGSIVWCAGCFPEETDTTLSVSADSLVADSVSRLIITANLTNPQSASPNIIFSTDHGIFLGPAGANTNIITVAASGSNATATLISSTDVVPKVIVTVSGNGQTVTKILSFTPSYPEQVFLNSNTYFIKLDGTSPPTVSLYLSKRIGVVSNHFPIDLSVDSVFNRGSNYGIDLPSRVYADKQTVSFSLHNTGTDTSYFRIKARFATSATSFDSAYMHVYVR
jgi:hypothetical protein